MRFSRPLVSTNGRSVNETSRIAPLLFPTTPDLTGACRPLLSAVRRASRTAAPGPHRLTYATSDDSRRPWGVESPQEGEGKDAAAQGYWTISLRYPPTSYGDPLRYSRQQQWEKRLTTVRSARARVAATDATARVSVNIGGAGSG